MVNSLQQNKCSNKWIDVAVSTAYLENDVFGFLLVLCDKQGASSLSSSEHHPQVRLIRHVSYFLVETLFQIPLNETVLTKVLYCCFYNGIKQRVTSFFSWRKCLIHYIILTYNMAAWLSSNAMSSINVGYFTSSPVSTGKGNRPGT